MQRVAVGFVLGLVVGVAAGWVLGAGAPPASPARGPRDAVGRDETYAPEPAAAPGRGRVHVDPRARGRLPRRGGTPTGHVPPSQAPPTANPAPEEATADDGAAEPRPEVLLARLHAIAAGTADGWPGDLANQVVQAGVHVPWETVVALARSSADEGVLESARTCLETWTEPELERLLALAADDAHPDAEALRRLAERAATELAERAFPSLAQVTALAEHADARLRAAAARLAYGAETPPFDLLVSMARDDPDDAVRRSALEIAAWVALESEDPQLVRRALPALESAARTGSLELRRTAIEALPDAGPGASVVALEVLLEDGVEEELAYALAQAVVNGGRLGALVRGARTAEQRRNVARGLYDADVPADELRRHARDVAALAADLDGESAYELYWLLVDAGAYEAVAAAATAARLRDTVRMQALTALLETDDPVIAAAGVEAVDTVLAGPSGTTMRRHAVHALGGADWSGWDDALTTHARELLRRVATHDTNPWVRGAAVEVLDYVE